MKKTNKEQKQNINEQNLPESALQKIKTELRNWYGSLSVRELVTNKILVKEIETLEHLLSGRLVV
jgi:hypothetical protein